MKHHIYYLLFVFSFSSLYAVSLNAQQTKEWTLLIYMVGTDIVNDAIDDVGEIMAAGNTDNINIVGLYGGSNLEGWQFPTSSVIVDGEEFPETFEAPIDNMANPTNITAFINWGIENYPAEKYMLLFYNHGMDIRGFGWDETVDDQNSIADLHNAIGDTDFIFDGNKFEVLGFDACLMACFESMSALRDYANYYVASEETEPGHAWFWTPIITAMNTQTGLDGAQLGQIIVDNYFVQSQSPNEMSNHVTLSVTDLRRITPLETALDSLILELNDDLYLENFLRARAASEEYGKATSDPQYSEDMTDLGDLVKHLKEFEPGLSNRVDTVLARLDSAVVYSRSDSIHPLSTGISIYVPFHVLSDEDEANTVKNTYYNPIPFSSTIKNFIANEYLPFGLADDEPITGGIDPNFGNFNNQDDEKGLKTFVWSAINIPNPKDLDQVQVVLMEEIAGVPDEYLLLGSSYPDTTASPGNGSLTYAYAWDGEWLGLNGHPAYVADIQYFDVPDENGEFLYGFTRVHIPALLNAGTADEKEIIFTFSYDDMFNHTLESILREPYGEQVNVPAKERIQLQPGDEIQLLYEVFDAATNASFYVANENAIITIENGNEDISLEHDLLEPGRYHLGFVLTDHAQNDTIIYDPVVHEVVMVDTEDVNTLSFTLGPNPTRSLLHLVFPTALSGSLELRDANGRLFVQQALRQNMSANLDLSAYPAGVYSLSIQTENQQVLRQIIKL